MEGLIPMVYKSLKKNTTRRQYECLSSGAAQTYSIPDFYINHHHDSTKEHIIPGPDKDSRPRGADHRRYNSVHVSGGFALGEEEAAAAAAAAKPKQLVRFRSHRMLSCVTGA